SELVLLDRERCVLCWRCVRFCREVSGDKEIELLDRGSLSQINRGPAEPFDSYFSGNTIQICPVGALTSKPYRFLSRPWDLLSTATTCSFCAVGCPLSVERRGDEVLRAQALPNGPGSVGFIGGSHATNEDLYAASLLFRDVVGTPNLDFRTFDATFDYGAFGKGGVVGSSSQLGDLDRAKTILWFGPDPKEELPVLYLRLRHAVKQGATLLVAHPRRISLCDFGTHLAYTPNREAELVRGLTTAGAEIPDCGIDRELIRSAGHALAQQPVVVAVGQQFPGRRCPGAWDELATWARSLENSGRATVLLCVPNAHSQGALDMGVYP